MQVGAMRGINRVCRRYHACITYPQGPLYCQPCWLHTTVGRWAGACTQAPLMRAGLVFEIESLGCTAYAATQAHPLLHMAPLNHLITILLPLLASSLHPTVTICLVASPVSSVGGSIYLLTVLLRIMLCVLTAARQAPPGRPATLPA
jgi:hypothetical protein